MKTTKSQYPNDLRRLGTISRMKYLLEALEFKQNMRQKDADYRKGRKMR